MIIIQNLKLFFYLFFKNKLLIISFALFFLSIHALNILNFIFYRHDNLGMLSQLSQSLMIANFVFIIFVFISYEYFYVVRKSDLIEVLKSTKLGVVKLYLCQFLVLLMLNIIVTLSYSIYNVAIYFYYGFGRTDFLTHILLNMLLNFFILQIVGTLVGWVLASLFKRLIAYMISIFFLFLSSRIFEEMAFDFLYLLGINLYPIYDFLNFSEPSLGWSTNFHFGFSVLPDRFWLMFAWITMLLSIIVFKLIRKKKRNSLTIISLLFFTISIYFYQQPHSRFVMNGNLNGSLMYDIFHYKNKEIEINPPNFNVLNYDLNIVVVNRLYVTATLTVDEELPKYHFTLYHRYVITKITNQYGETMDFVQEGDHFRVYNSVETLEKIIIHYMGYSPRFYSNRQGVMLPGFFPYFPHAGHHAVFSSELGTFEQIILPQDAYFNITITGVNNVFSNLEQVALGHFSGRSTSVTLVSGFLNSQTVDEITVVYPFLNHTEFNYENNNYFIREFIRDFENSDQIEMLIILPNLNLRYMATVVHDNHITARGLIDLAEFSRVSKINPRKRTLYFLIDLYLNDRYLFYEEVNWELYADITPQYRYAIMMEASIEELGLELFLELSNLYIENDADNRSISEFLLDL